MPIYNYKAMSRDGFVRTGSLEANNEADLEKRLLNLRLDLIRASTSAERKVAGGRRVERSDVILFCMQMAQLVRAGVPLLEALTDLRDSVESPEFKEIIGSLIEVIESGQSMSQAMETSRKSLTPCSSRWYARVKPAVVWQKCSNHSRT